MRILVLAQKGDWTACESALKALERSALDDGGSKHPLSGISDNVSLLYAIYPYFCEFSYNSRNFTVPDFRLPVTLL